MGPCWEIRGLGVAVLWPKRAASRTAPLPVPAPPACTVRHQTRKDFQTQTKPYKRQRHLESTLKEQS